MALAAQVIGLPPLAQDRDFSAIAKIEPRLRFRVP
jgi:hypothetical protein